MGRDLKNAANVLARGSLASSLSHSLSSFSRLCARIKRICPLMAASVPSSGSLLTHLVSRIESDLTFLASHNLVTAPELQQIRSTLAEAQVRANGAALELLTLRNDPVAHNAGGSMVPVPVQQQQQPKPQCKAVWDYTKSQVSFIFPIRLVRPCLYAILVALEGRL